MAQSLTIGAAAAEFKRRHALPATCLQGYIDRFWAWEQAVGCVFPELLPGTGAECFFNYRDPLRIIDVNSGHSLLAPQAFLLCNRQQVLRLEATGQVGFISVRFCAGQLRHFMRTSFQEIQDRFLPLADLWPQSAAHLIEAVASAERFSQRVALLEPFFIGQLDAPESAGLDRLISTIYYHPAIRVERLAEAMNWSRRNLDRRFLRAFGLSPKRFARIARLQQVARSLALSGQGRLVDVVLDAGFFDQAHFYHDLHRLTGLSPSRFTSAQQGSLSFYWQPSRRQPVTPFMG